MGVDESEVASFRRFSRFYTRQIDLLNEVLLASAFTLTEARVLYELAHRDRTSAAELGRDLRIDAGYLSRILTGFEARGFLARAPSPSDARQAELAITPAGRGAFEPLDRASASQAERLLEPLSPGTRRAVVSAMETIEAALGPERPLQPVHLRDLRAGDIGWIAHRHGVLYAAEFGWDGTIEAMAAEIGGGFLRAHDPDRERAWVAERGCSVLGSVFVVRDSDAVAKLRLLYVEPEARGLGLGQRLVDTAVAFARERGYREMRLWTNDVLRAARRLYEASGFQLVEETPHQMFGPPMVGQTWSLLL